jgi:type II restriction enzyme
MDFLGRTSTSSARYQDDVFNDNAVPPEALVILGKENRKKNGIVEAYIYKKFKDRFLQLSSGLEYCSSHEKQLFNLTNLLQISGMNQFEKKY